MSRYVMPADVNAATTMPLAMPHTVSESSPTSAAAAQMTAPPTIHRIAAIIAMSRGMRSARIASTWRGRSPRSSQRSVRRCSTAPTDTPTTKENSTISAVVVSTTRNWCPVAVVFIAETISVTTMTPMTFTEMPSTAVPTTVRSTNGTFAATCDTSTGSPRSLT
jgi:hypothetical protein